MLYLISIIYYKLAICNNALFIKFKMLHRKVGKHASRGNSQSGWTMKLRILYDLSLIHILT